MPLFSDLVVLLFVLFATAIVLIGWGNLTWKFLGIALPAGLTTMTTWLGFCLLIGTLEIVHLIAPIDYTISFIVALVGIVGFATGRPLTLGWGWTVMRRHPIRTVIAFLVLCCWCIRAMETPTMYDSGLYHFGTIRWLNEYPIVLGLGNVHWRLGLNQSYFGFLALLNIAPYWGKGYAAGGLFLLMLAVATAIEFSMRYSRLWTVIFGGMIFSYLCLLSGSIANPLPDIAVAVLEVIIFLFLFSALSSPSDCQHNQQRNFIVLVFLCFTAITIKLSSIGFAFASFLLVIVLMHRQRSFEQKGLVVLKVTGLLIVFFLVHIGRGFLLSGAPFFPSPLGGIWSLPWSVELGVAQYETALIYAWAKQPGIQLASELPAGFGWIPDWWATVPLSQRMLFIASTVVTVSCFCWGRYDKRPHRPTQFKYLFLPILSGLVFWFFTAPDIRFLGALGILFAIWAAWYGVLTIGWDRFDSHSSKNARLRKLFTVFGVFVGASLFIRWSAYPAHLFSGWRPIPSASVQKYQTRSGLDVFVPALGGQCWDSALPCAVILHDSLRRESIASENRMFSTQHFMFTTR